MQLLLILLLFGSRRLFNSSLLLSLQRPLVGNARDGVAIFGCGVLGTNICQQILNSKDFAGRTVTGITKSTSRHDSIRDVIGKHESRFNLMTYEEVKNKGERYRDIIFCAPPSGFDDYSSAVRDVTKTICGDDGTMVFTSSGSIYGGLDGEIINERSPLADTPRAKKLILAENAYLELGRGGIVLRLAGLYSLERGPHKYWLTSGKDVVGREDGIVNLVHYDDAATACIMALKKKKKNTNNGSNVFLISDGNPMTRRQICESARRSPLYAYSKIPKFLGTSTDFLGKVYDGSWSNKVLNWKPKYVSFDSFMSTQIL